MAAAFGASGRGDIAILMLTLPGLAGRGAGQRCACLCAAARVGARGRGPDRRDAAAGRAHAGRHRPRAGGAAGPAARAGRRRARRRPAGSAAARGRTRLAVERALRRCLLACCWPSLGMTRLQHERDFVGMYASNLFVNFVLIAGLLLAGRADTGAAVGWLVGMALLLAMLARLAWQQHRQRRPLRRAPGLADSAALPALRCWLWAAHVGRPAPGLALRCALAGLAAGRPARWPPSTTHGNWSNCRSCSRCSSWARWRWGRSCRRLPVAPTANAAAAEPLPVRTAFALGRGRWPAPSAAGLMVAAPAIAQILFGWGRMQPRRR